MEILRRSGLAYMCMDGLAIEIQYDHSEVGELLGFLLPDMMPAGSTGNHIVARYAFTKTHQEWRLSQADGSLTLDRTRLVDLLMPLLNSTMMEFSRHNTHSVSLHAALLSDNGGSVLMPGAPGSGKSNACLWLSHLGMHYHSDEFVTVNRKDLSVRALTRPYTLRKDALPRLHKQLPVLLNNAHAGKRIMESAGNVWIEHRLINPDYQRTIPTLKSIIFPVFTTGNRNQLVEISRARVGMELMRAHFQSQSFADHGFATISRLARSVPAYLVLYNHDDSLVSLLQDLLSISPKP